MEESKLFQQALSNFTADVAYVKAVRHLHDLGLSPEAIQKECMYPVSVEKIEKTIADYEEEKAQECPKRRFIEEVGPYGRKTFRLVEAEENACE